MVLKKRMVLIVTGIMGDVLSEGKRLVLAQSWHFS